MNYEAYNSPEYQNLINRLEQLFDALWYCRQYQEVGRGYIFTPFQRILINQERAAIFTQQDFLLGENKLGDVRHHTLPTIIEEKIQIINSNK
ncbi:hypothetical protein [Flavobacterium sp.]